MMASKKTALKNLTGIKRDIVEYINTVEYISLDGKTINFQQN